jgi:molybdopterin-guanine dinucleotide biosynthesis protein A
MKAVILTGGKSSRMGQDKATLEIGGVTLLDRMASVVRPLTEETFLSVAHDDDRATTLPALRDLEPSPGPLGGLQAAFRHDSEGPWLVLACDLALITTAEIERLVEAYDPASEVTCFLSPLDKNPEPLCAIYAPSAAKKLEEAFASGRRSARQFVDSLSRIELEPFDPRVLLNLNRPEYLVELRHLEKSEMTEKEITIEYFAKLSGEAGVESEVFRTSSATLAGVWEELRLRHRFSLDLPHVKPAINNEFVDWTALLEDGQTIAFMPPFAGG